MDSLIIFVVFVWVLMSLTSSDLHLQPLRRASIQFCHETRFESNFCRDCLYSQLFIAVLISIVVTTHLTNEKETFPRRFQQQLASSSVERT